MPEELNPNIGPIKALAVAGRIFTRQWQVCLAAALSFYLPLQILTALIPQRLSGAAYALMDAWRAANTEAYPFDLLWNAFLYSLVSMLISLIFGGLAAGAAAYVAGRYLKNEPASPLDMLERTAARAPKFIATQLLLMMGYALSSLLLFIPMAYLAVAMCFSSAVIADTGRWGFAALGDSRRLTRRRFWRTLWFLLVIGGLEMLVALFVPLTGVAAADAVIGFLRLFVCFPLTISVGVLYYARQTPAPANISIEI